MESTLLKFLGGEQAVQRDAPRVYSLLQNTVCLPCTSLKTAQDTQGAGTGDYVGIDSLVASMQGVQMRLKGCFTAPVSFLAVVGTLYDEKLGRIVDSFDYYFENTTYEAVSVLLEGVLTKQADPAFLRASATFTWSVDEKKVMECTRVFALSQTKDNDGILESAEVSAPRAKNKSRTMVLYDRESFVSEKIDYHYTGLVLPDRKSTKIKMPFSGKIRVREGFELLGVMERPEIPTLYLIFENGTYASYENAKGIVNQLIVSEDKRELTWDFDVDWQTIQSLERINANTIVDIHAGFTLNVIKQGKPSPMFHPLITVNSVETQQVSALGAVEIERIQIQWGCLAMGTLITMEDGTRKPIEQIGIGGRIRNAQGDVCVVEDIMSGNERTLIHIETLNGDILRATDSHPISTTRGFIPAVKLTAADFIRTERGDSQIRYLYSEEHNGKVYNLLLSPPGAMICAGIFAGDFEMQNSLLDQAHEAPKTELQTELRRIFGERSDNQTRL